MEKQTCRSCRRAVKLKNNFWNRGDFGTSSVMLLPTSLGPWRSFGQGEDCDQRGNCSEKLGRYWGLQWSFVHRDLLEQAKSKQYPKQTGPLPFYVPTKILQSCTAPLIFMAFCFFLWRAGTCSLLLTTQDHSVVCFISAYAQRHTMFLPACRTNKFWSHFSLLPLWASRKKRKPPKTS